MSGTDWLRALVKRGRTPATGGLVTADQAPVVLPTGYLMPTAMTEPADAMPIGIVEISGTVSKADAEQIRQQLQITPRSRTPRSEPLRCTCVAIYSECRCTDTNISAQTKGPDFHVEQQ